MTNEQMTQFCNSLTSEQLQSYGGYPSAASEEPSSSQQAGLTNEQMTQLCNSLTSEQLLDYAGYDPSVASGDCKEVDR
ncbi:hypothetical protein L202_03279 [Cryptococcus amylolentus CBS 6039]|uniref:Uncharacterized protein n=2 Tax=Cryptococcus amylolentus TaxID=104669 RepID=A0A1E3HSZ5_9TREE|nr:hypothetical protein L202_03279 [Cryptococcus amylolentus CBS 6039]ODN79265.1 hypothetical protein L202_03279 [Cryptococcus amylolentus CBS 6039]